MNNRYNRGDQDFIVPAVLVFSPLAIAQFSHRQGFFVLYVQNVFVEVPQDVSYVHSRL